MVRKDFMLQFGSLKEGNHDFDYKLDDDFFSLIPQDLIEKGEVNVLLKLEKAERRLTLNVTIDGWVQKKCDVCLSDLQYPVKSTQILHVKITDKEIEEDSDLIGIGSNEYELDLVQHLFDYVYLSLPMKLKCSDSLNRNECDDKVLEMLAGPDEDGDNSNHPEWQKLKEIFKN